MAVIYQRRELLRKKIPLALLLLLLLRPDHWTISLSASASFTWSHRKGTFASAYREVECWIKEDCVNCAKAKVNPECERPVAGADSSFITLKCCSANSFGGGENPYRKKWKKLHIRLFCWEREKKIMIMIWWSDDGDGEKMLTRRPLKRNWLEG